MSSTIIQQGRFTSDGTAEVLDLREDIDWMEVYNATVADNDTQTTGVGVQFYWQKGMDQGTGIEYLKSDAANATQLTTLVASGGFTTGAGPALGTEVVGTTITKASPAVCTATAHGFSNGDIVQLTKLTEMPQLAGIFFTIGAVTANTFELSFLDTTPANFTAETAFTVRRVEGYPAWNQSLQSILSLTIGGTTSVVLSASGSNIAVGDVLRFRVSAVFGTSEINNESAKVLAINPATNTYTLEIDSSSFTAFAFPAASAVPFTLAQLVPVGTVNSSSESDASRNNAQLTVTLGAGINGPAGVISDVVFWRAGKSFSVTNE